jgi:hypothetical protein
VDKPCGATMVRVPNIPTTPSTPGVLQDDLQSDVHDIVADAVQWHLAEADWPKVETLVEELHRVLRAGDTAAVESALVELELAAPLRITPVGGPPTNPAPTRLWHVAAEIVHDLGAGLDLSGPGDETDQDGAGADGDATG